MKNKKVTVEVNGKKLHLELGHTIEEWLQKYGENPNVWDFTLEELLDGTIEINESILYWYANGRCCETEREA